MDMHQASANIAGRPSDALGDQVGLPPSAGELMSMVVSAVASRPTSGDVRTSGVGGRRRAPMQR
jgi:hypothetical protein